MEKQPWYVYVGSALVALVLGACIVFDSFYRLRWPIALIFTCIAFAWLAEIGKRGRLEEQHKELQLIAARLQHQMAEAAYISEHGHLPFRPVYGLELTGSIMLPVAPSVRPVAQVAYVPGCTCMECLELPHRLRA